MIHTAIYIEDGKTQLVLTPGNKLDQQVLDDLQNNITNVRVYRGSFYACAGGWTRHDDRFGVTYGGNQESDRSLIFVLNEKQREVPSAVFNPSGVLDSSASSPTQPSQLSQDQSFDIR